MSKWHYTSESGWIDPDGNPSEDGPASNPVETLSPRTTSLGSWPVLSDAAGCHPDQIPEFRQFLSEKGVEANYTPDGRLVMESHDHRKRCLKALGMVDRNSYTGH